MDAELLAGLLDDGAQGQQLVRGDAGEEVVLDLDVDARCVGCEGENNASVFSMHGDQDVPWALCETGGMGAGDKWGRVCACVRVLTHQ